MEKNYDESMHTVNTSRAQELLENQKLECVFQISLVSKMFGWQGRKIMGIHHSERTVMRQASCQLMCISSIELTNADLLHPKMMPAHITLTQNYQHFDTYNESLFCTLLLTTIAQLNCSSSDKNSRDVSMLCYNAWICTNAIYFAKKA